MYYWILFMNTNELINMLKEGYNLASEYVSTPGEEEGNGKSRDILTASGISFFEQNLF